MPSAETVARISDRGPIAATKDPGNVDAAARAIERFIKPAPETAFLRRDPVLREAFWQLALVPYQSPNLAVACRRIAAILDLVKRATRTASWPRGSAPRSATRSSTSCSSQAGTSAPRCGRERPHAGGRAVEGEFDVEGGVISAYLDSDIGRCHVRAALEREVSWRLVSAPYEVSSIEALCRHVGSIMRTMNASEADRLCWMFEHTLPSNDEDESQEARS